MRCQQEATSAALYQCISTYGARSRYGIPSEPRIRLSALQIHVSPSSDRSQKSKRLLVTIPLNQSSKVRRHFRFLWRDTRLRPRLLGIPVRLWVHLLLVYGGCVSEYGLHTWKEISGPARRSGGPGTGDPPGPLTRASGLHLPNGGFLARLEFRITNSSGRDRSLRRRQDTPAQGCRKEKTDGLSRSISTAQHS